MGSASSFPPERLVLGILTSPEARAADAGELERELAGRLGPFERGPELSFPWSGYYDAEMGGRPARSFATFARLVEPSTLPDIKRWTNELELRLARAEGGRLFNLDPGLLSLNGFILATTKARPHRLPLRDGIYGELTLMFDAGDYRPLPWTYPDWASEEYRAYLRGLREALKIEARSRLRAR
jgi:hypothetical protein